MFLTAQPSPLVRFRRAIERRALWMAEDAAREVPNLPLENALQLVRLYAERGSPKYAAAARRWLQRYLDESAPGLEHLVEVITSLARRAPGRQLSHDLGTRCYLNAKKSRNAAARTATISHSQNALVRLRRFRPGLRRFTAGVHTLKRLSATSGRLPPAAARPQT